jgi:hypothetical protein
VLVDIVAPLVQLQQADLCLVETSSIWQAAGAAALTTHVSWDKPDIAADVS